MYYFFAFLSRTNAMKFYELLRKENVSCNIISTPPAAQVGCGLSVRVSEQDLKEAQRIFSYSSFGTFLGIFRAVQRGYNLEVERYIRG